MGKGKIVKILVEKGDSLTQGDDLAILEAMKMETTITAPFNGVVTEIFCQEQEIVQRGQELLKLE